MTCGLARRNSCALSSNNSDIWPDTSRSKREKEPGRRRRYVSPRRRRMTGLRQEFVPSAACCAPTKPSPTRKLWGVCSARGRAGGGADRNHQGLRGFGGPEHVALTVEDGARLDHQAGAVNFAGDDGVRLDFYAAAGVDYSVEAAGDDHAIAVDVSFDRGVLAEDKRVVGSDGSLQRGV